MTTTESEASRATRAQARREAATLQAVSLYCDGLTQAEIARKLRISRGAVAHRLAKATPEQRAEMVEAARERSGPGGPVREVVAEREARLREMLAAGSATLAEVCSALGMSRSGAERLLRRIGAVSRPGDTAARLWDLPAEVTS